MPKLPKADPQHGVTKALTYKSSPRKAFTLSNGSSNELVSLSDQTNLEFYAAVYAATETGSPRPLNLTKICHEKGRNG